MIVLLLTIDVCLFPYIITLSWSNDRIFQFRFWLTVFITSLSLNKMQCMQKNYIVISYQQKLFLDSLCGKLDSSKQQRSRHGWKAACDFHLSKTWHVSVWLHILFPRNYLFLGTCKAFNVMWGWNISKCIFQVSNKTLIMVTISITYIGWIWSDEKMNGVHHHNH